MNIFFFPFSFRAPRHDASARICRRDVPLEIIRNHRRGVLTINPRFNREIRVSPKKFPAMLGEADEAIRRRHARPRVVDY